MSVQTCDVLCSLLDQSGNPIDGARITARLMGSMLGSSLLTSDIEDGLTNGKGECTLVLAPNTQGTTYTFEIQIPGNRPRFYRGLKVPARASVTLAELLGWDTASTPSPLVLGDGPVLFDGFQIVFTDPVVSPALISGGPLLFDGFELEFSEPNFTFAPLSIGGAFLQFGSESVVFS
jgi:hypothetical protein